MSVHACDVLVVGGGLTGLAFALLLEQQAGRGRGGLAIGLIEAGPAPSPEVPAEAGLRVVALSRAARAILAQCRAWDRLPAGRVEAYRRMVVWHHHGAAGGPLSITFDAAAQGVAELGYIVENELLRASLWRAAAGAGIGLASGTAPVAAAVDAAGVRLRLADGTQWQARLVVGADGHDSWLRAALGAMAPARSYGQHAVVAHVASERPHQDTAWQRFLPGGPLALLPLADGRCSIVWSCAGAQARDLAGAGEAQFDRALTDASGGVLGALRVTTPRLSFPLAAQHAVHYTGLRHALIGDAAHRVHPLAGQGVNLGFLDAAALAEVLAEHLQAPGADPGDPLALRRYERWRKGANLATEAAMDALHHAFTSAVPGVARAAGAGLAIVDRLSPLKRRLADYAMGCRGDLPRVVRTARFS